MQTLMAPLCSSLSHRNLLILSILYLFSNYSSSFNFLQGTLRTFRTYSPFNPNFLSKHMRNYIQVCVYIFKRLSEYSFFLAVSTNSCWKTVIARENMERGETQGTLNAMLIKFIARSFPVHACSASQEKTRRQIPNLSLFSVLKSCAFHPQGSTVYLH